MLRFDLFFLFKNHQALTLNVQSTKTCESMIVCVCVHKSIMTHGVSSMTLQTLAMVLRQSVVFSSGRVLFYRRRKENT